MSPPVTPITDCAAHPLADARAAFSIPTDVACLNSALMGPVNRFLESLGQILGRSA